MDYVNRGNVSNTYTPNFKYEVDIVDRVNAMLLQLETDLVRAADQNNFSEVLIIKRKKRRLLNLLNQLKKAELEIEEPDSHLPGTEEGAKGVEETKDETTGAGKYYYPKRFS